MALQSPAYQQHPACQAYEDEISALGEWYRREAVATQGQTFWRAAMAEINARERIQRQQAKDRLNAALAAEGLRVVETFDPASGYVVDLAPADA